LTAVDDSLADDQREHIELTPPGMFDDPDEHLHAGPEPPVAGAMEVLRRGLAASPELRRGLLFTVLMALAGAAGRVAIPVLIQQVLDRGVIGVDEFQAGFVVAACSVAFGVTVLVMVLSRATYIRLVQAAEAMLQGLRVRAFAHLHRLSVADHNETKRGELTARVTSDIETIARFAQWGGIAWIVNTVMILGVLVTMSVYSWQLTLLTVAALFPMLPIMRVLQRRQLAAYDLVRVRVGGVLGEISESVMGAGVIRGYSVRDRVRRRLHGAIDEQLRAEKRAATYFTLLFPLGDLFGGLALAVVVAAGAVWGPGWGLDVGSLVAFVFLVNLLLNPITELGEILDQTQTALAGWRRVLDVLDLPIDVVEPVDGAWLPTGPLEVRAEHVGFAYRAGPPVLADIDVVVPAGASVAVVGETGSGKTTFAKLLCRLADPRSGRLVVGGVDLREVAPASRHRAIRMVPQDGFLFAGTVGDNVRIGGIDPSDDDVRQAFHRLGLGWWLERLPDDIGTEVGERGERLSVGERQLVALARTAMGDPGLLVLDEATSAVDPETERALTTALRRLASGRTTLTIAHRLSTAEAADVVLVFDRGRLVERGTHDELVASEGRYAELYESWLGNTRLVER
jgi:ATP-binding cassette, subfamily B, bacterial